MATSFPDTAIDSFPTHLTGDTITAASINNIQDAIVAIETKTGLNLSGSDISLDYKVNNFFVEGVRTLWFYEDSGSPPTGWTYQSGLTDAVLAVRGGSQAYNQTSGTGTAYGNFQMTTAQMPSHTHTVQSAASDNYGTAGPPQSSNTSGSLDHTSQSTGGEDGTFRPRAYAGFIAQYTGA